ncbi:PREDICTED: chymotrypsin-2-like [Ceratosolen solmsi marchali]|uniref:Chymotrypsin-2-like n=1 Tax=Ceratosolen solmsi marchali TaxID=326594 RepID=A0AAJ7DV54_9HYME|nr:PREDICTED: chymotrypsin-2-like [Ceratosolen solmsi marchali]
MKMNKTCATTKSVRLQGSEVASISEFSFIVQLRLFSVNRFFCAGSIISNKHILTAAHCIFQLDNGKTDIWIIAGSQKLSDNEGTSYYVQEMYLHPEFEGLTIGSQPEHNDIAVLAVRGFIIFNQQINKIDLPTQDITRGSSVILCGWGATSYPPTQFSNVLQKAKVTVVNCQILASEDQICTFDHEKRAIHGDSGGPVVGDGKLVGIISYGFPWISDEPDRHSNIFKHLDFINSVINF